MVAEEDKAKKKEIKIFRDKVPQEENEQQPLLSCIVDPALKQIERLVEQPFVGRRADGQCVECQGILGNKTLVIEQVLPHKVYKDWVTVRFVQFDTQNFRMKKIKVQLNQLLTKRLDFTVIDQYEPFGTPYLLVLAQQGLIIISLATGQFLHNINDLENIISTSKALPKPVVLKSGTQFRNINHIGQQTLFLSNDTSNLVFKLKIVDKNTHEDKNQIKKRRDQFIQVSSL